MWLLDIYLVFQYLWLFILVPAACAGALMTPGLREANNRQEVYWQGIILIFEQLWGLANLSLLNEVNLPPYIYVMHVLK